MADNEQIEGLIGRGDWEAALALLGERPELLETRIGWAAQTPLHLAVMSQSEDAVRALLDLGADVDARDGGDRATPLHWAAEVGSVEITALLLERGADPDAADDAHGWGPLGWATMREVPHREVAARLAEAGARPSLFPLIALDDGEGVGALLRERPEALSERLSLWEHYEAPLHLAISRGSLSAFEALVAAGADVDERSWLGLTPLAVAAFHGREALVERLRALGAVAELSAFLALGDLEAADAALEGQPGALQAGEPYGRLLHFAAEGGQADAVGWLLARGADPNGIVEWWDNRLAPLHPAASYGAADVVRLLLRHGADPTVRDERFDGTPLEWAQQYDRDEVVALLEDALS